MTAKPRRNWIARGMAMPEVARWYRFRAKGNQNSADVNLRNLLRCLERFQNKVPADLLTMSQEDLDDYVQDLVDFLETEVAGSAVKKYVESVKSFLAWHRRELKRPISIPGAEDNLRSEAQTIPDQQAMGALFAACDLRTSVIAALEAFSGVRPQVIGKFDGSDGLKLGDFPELDISTAKFTKVPTLIRVRKEISKTRKAYSTFLGPQGCEYLEQYLQWRATAGETLTHTSPAVTFETPNVRTGFVRRANVQDALRLRMRRVGIGDSSYILRSYFDNRMLMAESHAVPALYREYWMGHKGGMQMRYALRKEGLPPDVIEDMRASYAKALPFLETKRPVGSDDVSFMRSLILKVSGYTDQEIQDFKVDALSSSDLEKLIRPVAAKRVDPAQKVVGPEELGAVLGTGWMYRATLPDGRFIVEQDGP